MGDPGGLYCGDDGEYAGDAGRWRGEPGREVGEYPGEEGEYAGPSSLLSLLESRRTGDCGRWPEGIPD